MADSWFESVKVAQRRARRRLPSSVYSALVAGAERGMTVDDNVDAFGEIGLLPVTAGQPATREMATEVMGETLSMPVMMSPTGVQAVHPDGEVAVARAAAARNVPMGLSMFASEPLEAVIAEQPSTFFQLYWSGDREMIGEAVGYARQLGARGLILTLDWSFAHSRDWGSPNIPQSMNVNEMIRHLPEVALRPRWLVGWLRAGRIPTLEVPNMVRAGSERSPRFFEAYGEWMMTPPPTWEDVGWLRELWGGPFMVKGVMRVDEARHAVEAGATTISVSNHGGNNLDGSPAPIRVLGEIADAVGDQVEVVMDGGVRRGSDVVKAVALGARAVMIGRAYLWGLAANGQAGVENVLDIMRSGIDSTLLGLGRPSVHDVRLDDLVIAPGFTRPAGRTTDRCTAVR